MNLEPFIPPHWPRPRPMFTCSLCRAEHPCPDRDEWGVWPFPPTMTTERGEGGGWFARCEPTCAAPTNIVTQEGGPRLP